MLTTESKSEFDHARQRAFIDATLSYFTGRPTDLLSFEEIKKQLRLQDSAYKGLQEIELDKIVGSTGRYLDFNRAFLPKTDMVQERWRRIDALAHEEGYPPIEVYKVGDVYFVRDGNHRVSVARTHKAKTIEAYVIEYKTPVELTKDDDLDTILLKVERSKFLERTQMDELRPNHNIVFTEPGRYRLVREHIAVHKYLKETEAGHEISYQTATTSWYDTVYLPVIEMIRAQAVLRHFPERTEADLYAWLLLHRADLEKQLGALGNTPDAELLEDVAREKSHNPLTRLMAFFHRRLDMETLPLKVERNNFLAQTNVNTVVPDHNIECTESGCYQLLKEHIDVHKYLREIETSSAIPYPEAVKSWYYTVYQPVIMLIETRQILSQFPGHTKTDLYLWITSRRATLESNQATIQQTITDKVLTELEQESRATGAISRMMHNLAEKLHLNDIMG
jgi:hypothetical protein